MATIFSGQIAQPLTVPYNIDLEGLMFKFNRRAFFKYAGFGLGSLGLTRRAEGGAFFFKRMFSVPPRETPFITTNQKFYQVQYGTVPKIESAAWKLQIFGRVRHPLTLTYADFLSAKSMESMVTLKCIDTLPGGSTISNAVWQGPRLRDILLEAEIKSESLDVIFHAADGYTDSIPVERIMKGDVMLAHSMNGVALPMNHGYPIRIIVPGLYGIKNVKWITDIEVVNHDYQGYWQQRGWTDVGRIKTFSRIDSPGHYQEITEPEVDIKGIAFAGSRGVSKVEVSTTGGTRWKAAQITTSKLKTAWVLWKYRWIPPESGSFSLVVRAIDGLGQIQTDKIKRAYPDGSSGLHTIVALVNLK